MEEKHRYGLYLLSYKPTWELGEDVPGISSCEETYYQNRLHADVKTEPVDYDDFEQAYSQQQPQQNQLAQQQLLHPQKEQKRWQRQLWLHHQEEQRRLLQRLEQQKLQKQQQAQLREKQRLKKQRRRKEKQKLKRLQEKLRRQRRREEKQRLEMRRLGCVQRQHERHQEQQQERLQQQLRRVQRQHERHQEQQQERLQQQLQRQQEREIQQQGRLLRQQLREEKLRQQKQEICEEIDCKTTTSDVTYSCYQCSKTYSSDVSLKGHERYCNVDFFCKRCHTKLTSSQRYSHKKTCRPYECIHCKQKFKLIGGYHAHLSKYCPVLHQISPTNRNKCEIYACERCGNKCHAKSLETHMCFNRVTKTCTCLACGQVLKNREQIKIHMCFGKKLNDSIQADGSQAE